MRSGMLGLSLGCFAAALACGGVAFSQSAPVPVPPAAASRLPPGPGHDTMVRVCSGCHAPEIAAQQRLSHRGWEDLVNEMAGNGATATDAEFAQIVDYLAKAFPDTPPAKTGS